MNVPKTETRGRTVGGSFAEQNGVLARCVAVPDPLVALAVILRARE